MKNWLKELGEEIVEKERVNNFVEKQNWFAKLGWKIKYIDKLCWNIVWKNRIVNIVEKLDDQFGWQVWYEFFLETNWV